MTSTPVALLALLTLFTSTCAAQTTYKCVQDGRTVYQAQPCPADAKQDTLKKGTTAATAALLADIDRTIDFMASYRACADGIQVWGQEMAAPYADWRARNTKMVARIEGDSQLQAKYKQSVEARRNAKAGMCRDIALELRGKK